MYRDLSGDRAAEARLDEVGALTPALSAMGFTKAGLVAVGREGAVEQIWHSRDGDAFAEPSWFPGKRPHLSFRTLFRDGTIVETSWPREGVVRFIPFWSRQHAPGTGYFYEARAGMPHELWQRHRERIVAHAAARGTSVMSHNRIEVFLALAERAVRIARIRTRLAQVLGLLALTVAAIPVTVRPDIFPSWCLPLTALVWAAVTWGVFAGMVRSSTPKIEPAERLIERVRPKVGRAPR
ncbi:MAG: hypothetical protein IRZ16_19420 [Myxococcaceae bacterium]|nr:hypothetical protein [Myxococcaceae bacterium]